MESTFDRIKTNSNEQNIREACETLFSLCHEAIMNDPDEISQLDVVFKTAFNEEYMKIMDSRLTKYLEAFGYEIEHASQDFNESFSICIKRDGIQAFIELFKRFNIGIDKLLSFFKEQEKLDKKLSKWCRKIRMMEYSQIPENIINNLTIHWWWLHFNAEDEEKSAKLKL